MQPQVSQLLRLRMREDRHHAALVVKFVRRRHFAPGSLSFYLLASSSTTGHVGTAASLSGRATLGVFYRETAGPLPRRFQSPPTTSASVRNADSKAPS